MVQLRKCKSRPENGSFSLKLCLHSTNITLLQNSLKIPFKEPKKSKAGKSFVSTCMISFQLLLKGAFFFFFCIFRGTKPSHSFILELSLREFYLFV